MRTLDRDAAQAATHVDTLVSMTGISKRYGGVVALDGADLVLEAGRIHGVIGLNGSGKSTLLGILAGQKSADEGRIEVSGESVDFRRPQDAIKAGISIVTQELSLVPSLSVGENVLLGRRQLRRNGLVSWQRTFAHAVRYLEELDVHVGPGTLVSELPAHTKQLVEVARAVSTGCKVLILDEPTSSLNNEEAQSLFGLIHRLRDSGVAIVLVSHRINELMSICDSITVMRDGRVTRSAPVGEYTSDSLVQDMVGSALAAVDITSPTTTRPKRDMLGETRARFPAMAIPGLLDTAEFRLGKGEILGLAGLAGSGSHELLEAVAGLRRVPDGGTMTVDGTERPLPRRCFEAVRNGFLFVPPDRKESGLVIDMSVRANFMMSVDSRKSRLRWISKSREVAESTRWSDRLQVKAPLLDARVGALSGGNQQKVVLGRCLMCEPTILLLDEPTRGVDAAAKFEIHRQLVDARDAGLSVLVASSELDELVDLCDRVIVMDKGRFAGEIERGTATVEKLAQLIGAGASAAFDNGYGEKEEEQ
ncbi:sugar ABC transporter ATP-binding protein [Rhodococcus sp. NPDC055024]